MRTIEAMQRQLLGLIGRAVVKSISAATKCQTVDVSLIAGEPKAGVEHLEPYGFTARANSGAEAVVLFPDGDRSHAVVVTVSDRRYRLKGLQTGEVAVYDDQGQSVTLTRAVVISLFTWRRAEPDDNADVPMGWWGDTWPAVQNDRYGSRLWLLQRSKLTNQLVQTVRGYIRECLQWMIDDGVVSRIDLDIRRTGINELGNSITLWRRDGPVMISFDDLWSAITHGGQ